MATVPVYQTNATEPLQNFLMGIQQRRMQQDQWDQQAQQQDQQRRMQALVEMMRANPSHIPEIMAQNPDAFTGLNLNTSQFNPTAQEKASGNLWSALSNQDPTKPANIDPVYAALVNPDFGKTNKEISDAAISRFNYTNGQNLPQAVSDAQRVKDQLALSAQQQQQANENTRDYSTIKLPESQATVAVKGSEQKRNIAQAGMYGAEAGKYGAETAKVGEETKGLRQTNQLLSGVAQTGGVAPDASGAPPIVKMLVNRTYDPMLMRRWKPEEQQQILAAVQQYDPNFSMADYPTQVKAKASFNSGKDAAAIRSINQLIGHLDALQSAATALNNTRFPVVNAVTNFIGAQGGSTGTQRNLGTYNKLADAVANETETMLRGSSVSGQKEREEQRAGLSQNAPPEAAKGAIQATLDLMASRLSELDDQYRKGVGLQRDFNILNPTSRMILKKFNIDANAIDRPSVPSTPVSGGQRAPAQPGVISLDEALKHINGGQ